jgi:hypothetical protein
MADIADVRNAMVAIAGAAVYPNGSLYPSAIAAAGPIMTVPAYPQPSDLAGTFMSPISEGGQNGVVVAIYDSGPARDTTRFFPETHVGALPSPTLSWTVSGNTATLSGDPTVPQNLCLLDGHTDYVRAVLPTDTLAGIATAMAAMIPGASSTGPAVTTTNLKAARVGVVAPTTKEVGRQVSMLRVSVYAATDAIRSSVVQTIKPVLDDQTRMTLADGSIAWIRPGTEISAWPTTKLGLAQSILTYLVEYPTVRLGTAAQAIAWIVNISANGGPVIEYQG